MAKITRRSFVKGAGLAAGGLLTQGSLGAQTEKQTPEPGKAERFRALLAGSEPVLSPAAYDVLSARLIEQMGFPVITVGGSAVSAQHMIPDVGLITITELIEFAGNIAENVNTPVFADCDDGGGSPINVYRAMRQAEKFGIAAVMYEDTVTIKHLGGRSDLITKEQMVDKIKSAVDARQKNTVIIARTDALQSLGYYDSIARLRLAREAGADVGFLEGITVKEEARAVVRDLTPRRSRSMDVSHQT